MDPPNPTPFPAPGTSLSQSQSQSQSQSRKPKVIQRKSSEAPKSYVKETTLIQREKRVFGTARNPNVMTKPMLPELKTAAKKKTLSLVVPGKASAEISKTTPKKSPVVENGVSKIKKTVNFKEKVVVDDQNKEKKVAENDDVSGAQTPLRSPFSIKPRALGTPFLSAEKCSKCRFDKLETASYWIAQIKLADTVGKHFVSAVFFKMALECRAEPLRNIKVELKKYMARHEHLGNEEEWKALCIGYGLVKDESKVREQECEQQDAKIELTQSVSAEEDKNVIMDQTTTNEDDGEQIWFLVS